MNVEPEKPANLLSQRQRECLLWIARGKTYAETAAITGIAYGTVKTYLDQARYKLNCATLSQATAQAVAQGVLTPDDLAGRA